jgi:hypothetical protein
MRLSEWRTNAPTRSAAANPVMAVVQPVLGALGCDADPETFINWGDEPGNRWSLLAPTAAGLVLCTVRVNIPGEGPRASAKLVRWSRVQTTELAVETQGGHRLLTWQLEGQILRGADADADRIAAFALAVYAAIDGRPLTAANRVNVRGRTGAAASRARATAASSGVATRPRSSASGGTGRSLSRGVRQLPPGA